MSTEAFIALGTVLAVLITVMGAAFWLGGKLAELTVQITSLSLRMEALEQRYANQISRSRS